MVAVEELTASHDGVVVLFENRHTDLFPAELEQLIAQREHALHFGGFLFMGGLYGGNSAPPHILEALFAFRRDFPAHDRPAYLRRFRDRILETHILKPSLNNLQSFVVDDLAPLGTRERPISVRPLHKDAMARAAFGVALAAMQVFDDALHFSISGEHILIAFLSVLLD